jgi:hypothetical protein
MGDESEGWGRGRQGGDEKEDMEGEAARRKQGRGPELSARQHAFFIGGRG